MKLDLFKKIHRLLTYPGLLTRSQHVNLDSNNIAPYFYYMCGGIDYDISILRVNKSNAFILLYKNKHYFTHSTYMLINTNPPHFRTYWARTDSSQAEPLIARNDVQLFMMNITKLRLQNQATLLKEL